MKVLKAVLLEVVVFACQPHHSSPETGLSGMYVRETRFEAKHPESGKAIGHCTIRDTLFIQGIENQYEIRNRKWRKNDFDQQDWQDQQHSENRPLPTYQATYYPEKKSLTSQTEGLPSFLVDPEQGRLLKGNDSNQVYRKVK